MQLGNEHLEVHNKGPILSCVLNRPDSLNAFSDEMLLGLKEALREAALNDEVRVVVISGAGRAFSAGGDVKAMEDYSSDDIYNHLGELNQLILTIKELDKPVLAAVHGYAAGAGFNLALACDQILAAEGTQFALSFAQVGLVADAGGHYFLSRLLGPYRAKELLFRAEPLPVETAIEWGLVNRIYPIEKLEEEVSNYAVELAKGPGRAMGMMKKLVDQAQHADLAAILTQERITQTMMSTTSDHQEGVQAFKEKRKPAFSGNLRG
ncbi:enoyl-CoA hydratase [Halobacillus yeomjeoni]|uniref:enoyl-CoA hydratase/isomerase family protein n=1 Tax=Halobacillus yeomjeoni TaxID=311194 RepID=UPI001CD5280C|nr:enoyl-CoA hydratase [Halobacillus yeomjeoni]MCA0984159.1 enoyl-CoA hydratase [Halobacillus yeomjeoni]